MQKKLGSERLTEELKLILERGPRISEKEELLLRDFNISHETTIARVFYFDPEPSNVLGLRMAKNNDRMSEAVYRSMKLFIFPFAFVLKTSGHVAVGDRLVQNGDIIRLYDYKTKTIVNPKHIAYTENKESNSSAERLGELPEFYVSRLQNNYKDDVFIIHPTKEPDMDDYHTFRFDPPEIFGVYSYEEFKNLI